MLMQSDDLRPGRPRPARPPAARRVLCAAVLVGSLALTGCGGDPEPGAGPPEPGAEASAPGAGAPSPSPSPSQGREVPPREEPEVSEPAGGVAVSRVVLRSDVSSVQDVPADKGTVLLVPAERTSPLLSAAGAADTSGLSTVGFTLDAAVADAVGAAVRPVDEQGRFSTDVAAGSYLVCLADVFADHAPGPPFSVVGCAPAEVVQSGAVVVTFGEGGVEVTSP